MEQRFSDYHEYEGEGMEEVEGGFQFLQASSSSSSVNVINSWEYGGGGGDSQGGMIMMGGATTTTGGSSQNVEGVHLEGGRRRASRWSHEERSRSRSSSRHRNERRSKEDNKRHRRRSSSKSRSRSRSRSRSSSRSRSRSRHWRRRRRRSNSRTSRDTRPRAQYDSYKYQEPNRTVMVRGLASHLTEHDIRQDVLGCGIMIKDVRLIRDRETGGSRGFAFVEFNSVADSSRWMDMKKGLLLLHDQFQANLIYSVPKGPWSEGSSQLVADWICGEGCHSHNFKRREFCYKCGAPRPQDRGAELIDDDEVSSHPTSTIILSNLDTLTTEEGVLQAFQARQNMACIPIKSVKIGREPGSSLSSGLCYLETNNVYEAIRLCRILRDEPLEIDGRGIEAAYGRSSNPATLLKNSNAGAAALAAAQWTNSSSSPETGTAAPSSSSATGQPPCTELKSERDVEQMAQYCASHYAKTPEEYSSYLEYYRQYYMTEMAKTSSLDTTSSTKSSTSQSSEHPVVAGSQTSDGWANKGEGESGAHTGVPDYPDTSRYQYDMTSGYNYYDAESQQQFLHQNPQPNLENKYVSVSCTATGEKENAPAHVDIIAGQGNNRKGNKQDNVKVAKGIAKEMEKWAKTLNQKKDGLKQPPPETSPSSQSSSSAYPVSTSTILGQEYIYPAASAENPPTGNNKPSFIDEDKLACLLCKRQFRSMEGLQKHIKLSDLHKKNLEAATKSWT